MGEKLAYLLLGTFDGAWDIAVGFMKTVLKIWSAYGIFLLYLFLISPRQ